MKLNRYLYAAAKLVTIVFVMWVATGVTQALHWGAVAQVAVGFGVGILIVLWLWVAEQAVKDAREAMARIAREELHRDDVDALADSLTADVLAEQPPFRAPTFRAPTPEEWDAASGRPGRHALAETTQELFTHEQLFGDGTHAYHDMAAYNDVTEAFPGRLFPDGE